MSPELFHVVMYGFEQRFYPADEIVLTEHDDTKDIFIVASGCLELYTEFEGNEFIIERLEQGAILNYRVIFTEDEMHLNVRALGNTHCQVLTTDKLEEIQ